MTALLALLTLSYETRTVEGWTVQVDQRLLTEDRVLTESALDSLKKQLQQIVRVVPEGPVRELKKVKLWFSPEYKGIRPAAEFHPDAGWLKDNHRNPEMAEGVEFTNIRIFSDETSRMPNFALHELAHAYHFRVLGFDQPEIKKAYEAAKKSGRYDNVQRRDARGNLREDKAYAMTTPMEYFAESTESFFVRNDFFPFTPYQLQTYDPEMYKLLKKIWKTLDPLDP